MYEKMCKFCWIQNYIYWKKRFNIQNKRTKEANLIDRPSTKKQS